MTKLTPQAMKIFKYLSERGPITQLYASKEFGVDRLASRIYDLREAGIPIKVRMRKSYSGKRYAQYFLDDADNIRG